MITFLKATIFTFFLSVCVTHTFGQRIGISSDKLDSVVMNFVKELQSNGVDTICVYTHFYDGRTFGVETESRCSDYSMIFVPTYILWISNGKTFLHKKDNCYDYDTIEIDAQIVWDVFIKYQHQIKEEKVKVFEYKCENECYIKIDVHSYVRKFSIYIEDKIIKMWFYDLNMKKESDGYKNINYSYNQKLKGTILVDKLEELIKGIEKKNILIVN